MILFSSTPVVYKVDARWNLVLDENSSIRKLRFRVGGRWRRRVMPIRCGICEHISRNNFLFSGAKVNENATPTFLPFPFYRSYPNRSELSKRNLPERQLLQSLCRTFLDICPERKINGFSQWDIVGGREVVFTWRVFAIF